MKSTVFIWIFAVSVSLCFTDDADYCSLDAGSGKRQCNGGDNNAAYREPLIDCHPDPKPGRNACENRGCLWHNEEAETGAPMCTFPSGYGYRLIGEPDRNSKGIVFNLERIYNPTIFGSDVDSVTLSVEFQSNYRVRLKFYDPASDRYEVPLPTYGVGVDSKEESRLYDITWTTEPQFGVKVVRRANGVVVFDSSPPGFIFSDQFLQISTRLPSSNLYGFGEHNHQTLKHDMNWKTWVMFSKDVVVQHNNNLYGVQPFYINLESDGNSNGVFFKNSNAMEVALYPDPLPSITYRTIGGILDFYVFLGPSPEHVVQQYTEAVGRPLMPPYWSLGFMLSRWGYNSSNVLRDVIERNRAAGIPMDVQFGDIDYMFEELDFTYNRKSFKGLPEIIQDVHDNGQKFIPIVDFLSCWKLAKQNQAELSLGDSQAERTERRDKSGKQQYQPRDWSW